MRPSGSSFSSHRQRTSSCVISPDRSSRTRRATASAPSSSDAEWSEAHAEVSEYCRDAPIDVAALDQPKLVEDVAYVDFDRALRQVEALGDAGVAEALGDQREHVALAGGEAVCGEGIVIRAQQIGHDRRVDHAFAGDDSP